MAVNLAEWIARETEKVKKTVSRAAERLGSAGLKVSIVVKEHEPKALLCGEAEGLRADCGQCRACLTGQLSQCGHGEGYEAIGGWRFGNTINGAQAEYLLVPHAQANLAKIPDELTDEQVALLANELMERSRWLLSHDALAQNRRALFGQEDFRRVPNIPTRRRSCFTIGCLGIRNNVTKGSDETTSDQI